MTEASHLLGHINVCIMTKTKVIMFMWLDGSGSHWVDKLKLLLLDDTAIKVYEFVLWWPLCGLKKIRIDLQRERFPAACRI